MARCLSTNSFGLIMDSGCVFCFFFFFNLKVNSTVHCFFISTHFLPTIYYIWLERQPLLQENVMPILTSNKDNIKDKTAIKLLQGCNLLEHFYEIINWISYLYLITNSNISLWVNNYSLVFTCWQSMANCCLKRI